MATAKSPRPTLKKVATSAVKKRRASKFAALSKTEVQRERSINPLSRTLGATIKAMRIAKELSQEQLAGEAEMDRTAISLIERGRTNPTVFSLSVLARVLGVSLSELFAPISADMNLKPSWQDPNAMLRRANRATPERKPTPGRRLR